MVCPICLQDITKGTTITCYGQCKREFHLTCLALSVEDTKRILEKDMKWKCNIKYCFIGNGYHYFISSKEKELCYLVSRIESEIDHIEKLFKSYSSSVQNLTNGLNDFQGEFTKLKDRCDRRSLQEEDKPLNAMAPPESITLDELVSNGWVASKNKKLLKKSFEFENGSSAVSFINRTSNVLEKEPNENMPQITLQIKTVTIVLASKEQEGEVDNMMYKTAYLIDGAAPSVTEKDRPRVKQEENNNPQNQKNYEDKPRDQRKEDENSQIQKNYDNKPQDQRKDDNKPQVQKNYEDKTKVQDRNEKKPKIEQNNNREPKTQGDVGKSLNDEEDDEEEDDDDDDNDSQNQPRYFY